MRSKTIAPRPVVAEPPESSHLDRLFALAFPATGDTDLVKTAPARLAYYDALAAAVEQEERRRGRRSAS